MMKELVKQSKCEEVLGKYTNSGQLNSTEIKQLRTLYWAKRHRRRLVSVTPKLSKLEELPSDDDAAIGAALLHVFTAALFAVTDWL